MPRTRSIAVVVLAVAMLLLGTRLVVAGVQAQQFGGGGGMIHGAVYGFTYDDGLTPLAWAPVYASNGQFNFKASTSEGGDFEMYVPESGTWNVTVVQPGYVTQSMLVAVAPGSAPSINFYLEESHVPVPEFPSGITSVLAVIAFAAVLVAVKRTKRRK